MATTRDNLLVSKVPGMVLDFLDDVHTIIYLNREGVEGYEDVPEQIEDVIQQVKYFQEKLERLLEFSKSHDELEDILN